MPDTQIIKLIDVAKHYKALPHQNKALTWFDASTGQSKQETFARIYRNKGKESDVSGKVEQEPDISFVEAFKHYEATGWQANAMNWLQVNTQPETLKEFVRLWRSAPPKPTSDRSDYWQQMTHGGTRLPPNDDIRRNIEKACNMLEELERYLGVPLTLTSGYRDPATNAAVGGAKFSQHVLGLAADFYSDRMDDFELEDKVIEYWYKGGRGGVGRGQSYRGFTHCDCRGYPAIWDY